VSQAESWECDLKVPDLPKPAYYAAAAVLGQMSSYLSQFFGIFPNCCRGSVQFSSIQLSSRQYIEMNQIKKRVKDVTLAST
jgi:hypothetical protein